MSVGKSTHSNHLQVMAMGSKWTQGPALLKLLIPMTDPLGRLLIYRHDIDPKKKQKCL